MLCSVMLHLSKLIQSFNKVPPKISARFFVEIVGLILKGIWNVELVIAKQFFKEKNKVGGFRPSNFNTKL